MNAPSVFVVPLGIKSPVYKSYYLWINSWSIVWNGTPTVLWTQSSSCSYDWCLSMPIIYAQSYSGVIYRLKSVVNVQVFSVRGHSKFLGWGIILYKLSNTGRSTMQIANQLPKHDNFVRSYVANCNAITVKTARSL